MYQRVVSIPAGRDLHYFIPPSSVRTGLAFEEYIFRNIALSGGAVGADLRFERSPRSNDNGKDIVIDGHLDTLFGQKIGRSASKTVCEVKYSSGGLLKLSRFADTLVRLEDDITDVVVVCNNTPSPRTVYYATKQIDLIDKRLHFVSGTELNLYFDSVTEETRDHLVCMQLDERTYPNRIHYYFKNLSNSQTKNFSLKSRRDELTETEADLEFLVGPGEYISNETNIQDIGDFIEDDGIQFALEINQRNYDLELNRHLDRKTIMLPFWGSHNLEHLADCKASIAAKDDTNIILVEGGAGVGKSRFVSELTRSLRTLGVPILVISQTAASNKDTIAEIVKRESEYLKEAFDHIDTADPVTALFELSAGDLHQSVVLIFEDAHLHEPGFLQKLQKHIDSNRARRVIVTSRNDDTFFNPAYFLFAESLRSSEQRTKSVFLKPLPAPEERDLIMHVVSHVSAATIDRIQYLSNGNPFHLLITLEWLVENDLFQIVNNQRIAVVDGERFAEQYSLPLEISEMFKQSLLSLVENIDLDLLAVFAIMAIDPHCVVSDASIGQIPAHFSNAFLDDFNPATNAWRHDLAKTAFGELILSDDEFRNLRFTVFDMYRAQALELNPTAAARLAFNCGDLDTAWNQWSDLRMKIEATSNITSMDFDAQFFDSFDQFATMCFERSEQDLAVRALVIWCYLGCHYANLVIGQKACRSALHKISTRAGAGFESQTNEIKALELRSLIDSGLLNQARRVALECEMSLPARGPTKSALLFDFFLNRSDLQRLLNDQKAALHFLAKAFESAPEEQAALVFVEQSHRAALVSEPELTIGLLRELVSPNGPSGSERHHLIAECMLARVETLSRKGGPNSAKDAFLVALDRSAIMASRQYLSALPIAHRTTGITGFSAYLEEELDLRSVRDAYRMAENSCVLKGEAESLPLVLNDMAILEFNITNREQDAMMFLSTSIDVLNRQGRLDIGAADLTSANQVIISNYLRLLSKISYSRAIDFVIERVQWFEKASSCTRGTITRELDRVNDTGLPFLSEKPGIYDLHCPLSGLKLVG